MKNQDSSQNYIQLLKKRSLSLLNAKCDQVYREIVYLFIFFYLI